MDLEFLKAALIKIIVITLDQMTACHLKGVTCYNKLTKKYPATLQILSALLSFWVSFNSLANKQPVQRHTKIATFSQQLPCWLNAKQS